MMNEHEAARQRYEEALQLNPLFSDAFCGLGQVALLQGNSQNALEHYQEAIRLKIPPAAIQDEIEELQRLQSEHPEHLKRITEVITLLRETLDR